MRQTVSFLLVLLFSTALHHPKAQTPKPDSRGYIVEVGDAVPPFAWTDLEGDLHTSPSRLGTAYILQFTASWCGVCRA